MEMLDIKPLKQKLLPAPRITPKDVSKEVRIISRIISCLLFLILGFNFANSEFFYSYPLFGVRYLAQILITTLSGLAGYYVVPDLVLYIRNWVERLIVNTVVEIVSSFWELQSRKIHEKRREKQKQRIDQEKMKLAEASQIPVLLDTSVLIDGRVVDIIKLNFLDMPLLIPKEVIDELHALSDSKELLKRQKGRRGLDFIREIKKIKSVQVTTIKDDSQTSVGVDTLLLDYCKANNAKMATLDFNLAKVAEVSGIKVLNIHALALSLKTMLLPGEEVEVTISAEGKEKQQGLGYLDDGTMLVVENAKDKVGQILHVKVTKVIQSSAGKIIFCK